MAKHFFNPFGSYFFGNKKTNFIIVGKNMAVSMLSQVILVRTLTGVQGEIRCKVFAVLYTVKELELELA